MCERKVEGQVVNKGAGCAHVVGKERKRRSRNSKGETKNTVKKF